jgi:hypothetical protein
LEDQSEDRIHEFGDKLDQLSLPRRAGLRDNSAGLYTVNGGALYSYGNNHVNGNNGNDGSFNGAVGQQQSRAYTSLRANGPARSRAVR